MVCLKFPGRLSEESALFTSPGYFIDGDLRVLVN